MGRLFLRLGCFLTIMGCLVSVYGFLYSVEAIISAWRHVTDEMLGRPFLWCYVFFMNGALFNVFTRALDTSAGDTPAGHSQNPPR
jgi:hypothetical protein